MWGRNEATGEEVVAKVVIEVGGVYQASDGTGEERREIGWVSAAWLVVMIWRIGFE